MERLAIPIRELAHHLHQDEQVGQEGGIGSSVHRIAARPDPPHQGRCHFAGQHPHQGPPGWNWSAQKNGPQAIGRSRGGWTTKIHLVAADARTVVKFALSPGQSGDGPQGRELLLKLGAPDHPTHLLMDRAYEGNATRQLALDLGYTPVVPPLSTRIDPWDYDRQLYKRRNEVERVFRRIKGFRRVFSRFDKLDVMFTAFVLFALIVEALREC